MDENITIPPLSANNSYPLGVLLHKIVAIKHPCPHNSTCETCDQLFQYKNSWRRGYYEPECSPIIERRDELRSDIATRIFKLVENGKFYLYDKELNDVIPPPFHMTLSKPTNLQLLDWVDNTYIAGVDLIDLCRLERVECVIKNDKSTIPENVRAANNTPTQPPHQLTSSQEAHSTSPQVAESNPPINNNTSRDSQPEKMGNIPQEEKERDELKNKPEKPWAIDKDDPLPEQEWYIPARHFARMLVKEDESLGNKLDLLATKVAQLLTQNNIFKRGGKKPFAASTVKKSFTNCKLLKNSQTFS